MVRGVRPILDSRYWILDPPIRAEISEFGFPPTHLLTRQRIKLWLCCIEHRASSIEHRASSIEHRASSIEHRASSIEHRASSIEHLGSGLGVGGLRVRLFIAELLDKLLELGGHFGQLFSGHLGGSCSRSGVLGPGRDAGNALGNFRAPAGNL